VNGRRDRGSVSAFVVMLVVTFLVTAGLALDGARMVADHVRAADHAENAARVGAQEVTSIRAGQTRLDQARAVAAARGYLTARGLNGTVTASPTRVTVTVTVRTSFGLLRLGGVQGRSTSATRSSDPVRG
jgi:Flp pilus assembly protein TadG